MRIGPIALASPVVLAAGVTNVAFRSLCRELDECTVPAGADIMGSGS